MSTRLTSEREPAPQSPDRGGSHAKIAKRLWLSAMVVAIVGIVIGALVILAWMMNETHFDRPSQEFDALEAQIAKLPGVDGVEKERWVEAPTFSDPTSWMSVTVDQAGLPGVLDAACSTVYPDAMSWSVHVRTPSAGKVSLHAVPTAASDDSAGPRCPDFGFDAVRLVDELDRVAPGLAIQPAIWDNGRFAFVALEEELPTGFAHLLPLIENADALVAAAGLGANEPVEINSANLGVTLQPGESAEYLALLTELADEHAVSSYWADGEGAQADGVEKVQIMAPAEQYAAIEARIRSSGLDVADLPVRFLDQ